AVLAIKEVKDVSVFYGYGVFSDVFGFAGRAEIDCGFKLGYFYGVSPSDPKLFKPMIYGSSGDAVFFG
ncbi:unnamed protein product, partial [marine sediment metagenome]